MECLHQAAARVLTAFAIWTLAVPLTACGPQEELGPQGAPETAIPVCVQQVLSEVEMKSGAKAAPRRCYGSEKEMKVAEAERQREASAQGVAHSAYLGYTGPWYYLGELYEHINEGGARLVYITSVPCGSPGGGGSLSYVGDSWNDRISSISFAPWRYANVYRDSTCNGVLIYEHADYGGDNTLVAFGKERDQYCAGWKYSYFSTANMTGVSYLVGNVNWPERRDYNDRISSLRWVSVPCPNPWYWLN